MYTIMCNYSEILAMFVAYELGQGEYGSVMKGTYTDPNGEQVAFSAVII